MFIKVQPYHKYELIRYINVLNINELKVVDLGKVDKPFRVYSGDATCLAMFNEQKEAEDFLEGFRMRLAETVKDFLRVQKRTKNVRV